jgi:hypothetical protein
MEVPVALESMGATAINGLEVKADLQSKQKATVVAAAVLSKQLSHPLRARTRAWS